MFNGIIPPGGWVYTLNKILFYATSFDDLVIKVQDHKKANGYPEGNIQEEIRDQILHDNPTYKFPVVDVLIAPKR